MKRTRIGTAGAAALITAALLAGAPTASAVRAQPFDTWGTLADAGGAVITGYKVLDLTPAGEPINYPLRGRLYQATVTVVAERGDVTPVLPPFLARAANGDTYRVLSEVASPWGLGAATLPPGARATGRLYFDVVGQTPNSVIYSSGGVDRLLWVGEATDAPGPPAPRPQNPMMPKSQMPNYP
jgi:hypothetical protein